MIYLRMFISYLTIGGRCGKMEKCYNCGVDIVIYKELEVDAY